MNIIMLRFGMTFKIKKKKFLLENFVGYNSNKKIDMPSFHPYIFQSNSTLSCFLHVFRKKNKSNLHTFILYITFLFQENKLSNIGDTNTSKCARTICRYLFEDTFLVHYSWSGTKEKSIFAAHRGNIERAIRSKFIAFTSLSETNQNTNY